MTFTTEQLHSVITGTDLNRRIEALRQLLGYPVKERDPQGSRFWYLRPGKNRLSAKETQPIAVGFYDELNQITDKAAKVFITGEEQQLEIYGHYTDRVSEEQPVMYLLLPIKEETGRVALVLPTEGKLRQRQIQTFEWNSPQLLKSRLPRLHQDSLPIANKALVATPLVEWVLYDSVATAKELAQRLAAIARQIEEIIPNVYAAESENGYLHSLFASFCKELLPNLQVSSHDEKAYSFADIYAQTVAYGLFTARVFSYERKKDDLISTEFNRQTAWDLLPETNPFLRRLFQDISLQSPQDLGDELIEAIVEIISYLRVAKMEVILRDFHEKINQEDIVIRFYEDFLAAYKPQMRERRGVYYTPEPVVSYMVRSVDILLKDKFNKPLGLADPEVQILDPACGTGTFLLWICQLIYQRFHKSPDALTEGLKDKSWSGYVKERLLPRIFGFELLMAPYAIAHLKLGLFLEETGYKFDGEQRLGIYLTNSLESTSRKAETLFEEFIAEEADLATEIKRDKPISVVIGNPPYSALSANLGEEVRRIVEPYRYVDGERIVEKSALQFEKNLQDDYVKFFALSQSLIAKVNGGVVSLITNNGFIDSLTLRGMRSSLLDTFKDIYIFDLHGDIDKKEKAEDGTPDKNVFDIKQGVAMCLMVKSLEKKQGTKACLHKFDYLGSRESKYNYLNEQSLIDTQWSVSETISPNYLFKALNSNLLEEYKKGCLIPEIFKVNSTGFESGKDAVLTAYTQNELEDKLYHFCTAESKIVKEEFEVNDGWGLSIFERRQTIINDPNYKNRFLNFLFNPFDIRHTFYRKDILKTNSFSAGQHLVYGENFSLVVMRQVSMQNSFSHAFVASIITNNRAFYSKKGKASYFPLYIYSGGSDLLSNTGNFLGTNFQIGLIKRLCKQLCLKELEKGSGDLINTCGPENVFNYIYSILHSPTYRKRYIDFLKTDFPRIPFTSNVALFRQLATYGEELVALHLMKSPKLNNPITKFAENNGNCIVDAGHPKYTNGAVIINKKGDKFVDVPKEVWDFYIGGYQICQKWLKDRKGRQLSNEDIQHYQKIIVSLQETIELMRKIDMTIPSFPIQ